MKKREVYTNEEAAMRHQRKVGGQLYSAYNWAEQETHYVLEYEEKGENKDDNHIKQ